jgi:hypothetical protein
MKAPCSAKVLDSKDSCFGEKVSMAVSSATVAFATPAFAASEVVNDIAGITPSLKNTLLSVVAGGVVLAAIAAAVIGVSSFDKVTRK